MIKFLLGVFGIQMSRVEIVHYAINGVSSCGKHMHGGNVSSDGYGSFCECPQHTVLEDLVTCPECKNVLEKQQKKK